MARGGYRPGAGRPRKSKAGDQKPVEAKAPESKVDGEKRTPLEYMLHVMNSEDIDEARRDRMAIAAAPYVHSKQADAGTGKKEQRQKGAEGVAGKFGVRQPPRLVADNTK